MLNERAIKLCKEIGLNPDHLTAALSDEETIDVDQFVQEFKTANRSVVSSELKNDFDKKLKTNYGTTLIKVMNDSNKAFNLGYTNEQIKEIAYDDFVKESSEKINAMVKAAESTSDEELKAKYNALVEQVDTVTSDYETKLSAILSEKDIEISQERQKVSQYINRNEYNKVFSKIPLGVIPEHIPMWEDRIMTEVNELYNVNEGGIITDKEGNAAINFAKNGQYSKLEEPVKFLVAKYKIGKVSGGDTRSAPAGGSTSAGTSDSKSKAYNDLRSRALAAAKNQ